MYSKGIGIITTFAFVILAWYIYALYPFTMNLMFAILASTIAAFTLFVNYSNMRNDDGEIEIDKGTDIARYIFSGIAILLFFALLL